MKYVDTKKPNPCVQHFKMINKHRLTVPKLELNLKIYYFNFCIAP